jgi:hypothetical protein
LRGGDFIRERLVSCGREVECVILGNFLGKCTIMKNNGMRYVAWGVCSRF